ncbi:MAG: Asp-tRNA(Asn)/Glu-tRNA(Gln) amidotransferase GatCAB subunit C [Crocinitomicaceae bacterium]|nr:Asp-tRNA(Asn)/Glu-tRNA(Gln) amidotransferase GatCAB subunit C [Crocinitomicaceae bacterium]
MKVNKELIAKLSNLSKLKFNKEETELISEDLSKMVDFINQLNELETDGIEPLIHMNEEINNWREDKLGEVLSQEEALSNSPVQDSTYFKLPKVLDKN